MSIEKLIKFPRKHEKSKEDIAVVIRCDAVIKRNGKVDHNFCYEEGGVHFPFVSMINRAASKSVFNPARVNGTARPVYFQYYVLFIKKGSATSIEVIGNSGLEVDKYGVDYTSPQRYSVPGGIFGAGCSYNKHITVNAVISELGTVSSVAVEGDNAGDKCTKYLEESFKNQKFIPATYNGKAISAFYSELIFDTIRRQQIDHQKICLGK